MNLKNLGFLILFASLAVIVLDYFFRDKNKEKKLGKLIDEKLTDIDKKLISESGALSPQQLIEKSNLLGGSEIEKLYNSKGVFKDNPESVYTFFEKLNSFFDFKVQNYFFEKKYGVYILPYLSTFLNKTEFAKIYDIMKNKPLSSFKEGVKTFKQPTNEIDKEIYLTLKDKGFNDRLIFNIISQARFETDDYKSNVFKKNKNLFGYKEYKGSPYQIKADTTSTEGDKYAKYLTLKNSVLELHDWIKRREKEGKTQLSNIDSLVNYVNFLKQSKYFGGSELHYLKGLKNKMLNIKN